jgi:hypothetical protein
MKVTVFLNVAPCSPVDIYHIYFVNRGVIGGEIKTKQWLYYGP